MKFCPLLGGLSEYYLNWPKEHKSLRRRKRDFHGTLLPETRIGFNLGTGRKKYFLEVKK